ncbi:hypothetical protein PHAVU_011G043700 [Phaseolus vulgaris]|uniref:Uncharacterized protein n=1 Tax=Phaseolus vulgaris TaxID=3885 RepID=V7AG49_PHAVU|nr:hypothetical protein PHAVU_011G043700g [Phaseolus vulgaris]ESW03808.1 hypothetical protein PHAVU_011G043700g [Phaseolus vulgaris]
MAVIEKRTQNSLHLRSNSLPSAAHPSVSQFEEHLQRLRGSEATSSLSSSSVSHKLNEMLDLHDYTDKLLQLPIEQQVLAREKKGHETGLAVESVKYLAMRKTIKKQIRKALQNLKHKDNNNNTSPMLSFLNEAEAITLSSLENLLLFISGPKGRSKNSRWSAISKLVQPKRVICDSQESTINEFEKVDAALQSLISHKPSSVENFQSHMENLELCIQDLEIGVDHLSRKLIRNRVSLLNIFNH